jgi:hypothetical protein
MSADDSQRPVAQSKGGQGRQRVAGPTLDAVQPSEAA